MSNARDMIVSTEQSVARKGTNETRLDHASRRDHNECAERPVELRDIAESAPTSTPIPWFFWKQLVARNPSIDSLTFPSSRVRTFGKSSGPTRTRSARRLGSTCRRNQASSTLPIQVAAFICCNSWMPPGLEKQGWTF
jgi:hypothetical protein